MKEIDRGIDGDDEGMTLIDEEVDKCAAIISPACLQVWDPEVYRLAV